MAKLERYRTPSATRLLHHVLESPALVAAVRELEPAMLGKLIDAIGLESAGELVALASTSQLERVFDEDLWREDAVGDDPRFDPARFALWLEILLEAGETAVIARLTELPLDFLILAFARLVLVVDIDRLGVELSEDEEELELVEKALDASSCEEWEEFRLIARDQRAFDSVVTALFALDRDHHELLRRILERCTAVSSEYIADNGGLYEVLSADEMLEGDARAERDDRRAAEGYVAASDARSFLALARQGAGTPGERDPVTRAYFRELDRNARTTPGRARTRAAKSETTPDIERLTRLLAELTATDETAAVRSGTALHEAGKPRSERASHQGGSSRTGTAEREAALVAAPSALLLGRALAELENADPALHAERLEELGFLANVLIAGEPHRGRRFRPIEALETAVSVCDQALADELGTPRGTTDDRLQAAVALVRSRHLDELFRRGWHARQAKH
jgi:hypothetical protein